MALGNPWLVAAGHGVVQARAAHGRLAVGIGGPWWDWLAMAGHAHGPVQARAALVGLAGAGNGRTLLAMAGSRAKLGRSDQKTILNCILSTRI